MTKRVCAEPGCPNITSGRHCPRHRRNSPTGIAQSINWAERKRRTKAVKDWIATDGYWCPGWGRPGHPATDLTADHVTAVTNGGADGPLAILCRSCNSRKRDR